MPAKKSAACQAFGRAVRELRREQGYRQESFAAHAGIDRSYYGAIERGEYSVTLDTIMRLAGALETTAAKVFRRAGL